MKLATREIVTLGDEALRKVCREQKTFDHRLGALLDDMAATMYKAEGVGLAAPQIGVLRRVVVIDVSEDRDDLIELINPVIVETSGSQCGREGCLSLPGRQGIVTRPYRVTVQAQDRRGRLFEMETEGFLARAVCHELDHLDGTLYIDRMDRELNSEEIHGHVPEDDLEDVDE